MTSLHKPKCLLVALAGLLLWSFGALAEHYTVPLLVPAGTTGEPQGVVRILNATDESGDVEIYAIGDDGTRSGPATFTLSASAAVEFTATDLASGNATLGLTGGIGTEVGDARLQIETDLDIVPLAFVRAVDGTLSAIHDTVRGAASDGLSGYTYNVPVFNPSTEMTQVSRLRLINPGDAAAAVTIGGRDDSAAEAVMGDVTLALAAGGAKTLTAQQLEAGDTDLTGQLGAGTGKWRLTVSSDQPLEVVNIVASTAGYWNNLSTTAVAGAAPGNQAGFNERFVGNSVIYETSGARSTLEAADGNLFTDTVEADGVTETYMGSYSYRAIGPDAGLLTLDYDDGDACRANLYFSSRTSGWFASHCTGSDYPAEGSWLGGTWVVEDDDDDGTGDVTETTYEVNDALAGVPTSGSFAPSIIGGGSLQFTGSGTTIGLNNGAYFELNDGTRYTCTTANGCTIVNGTVTAGTVTGRAPGAGEVDRFPSFRTAAAPGNQTYTVGTAIETLTLPEAAGGNGDLTYSLSPNVPGLTFNATTRQLTGTPSAAGTHAMTYTVTDEDGDSDTLNFSIDVAESDEGVGAADSFGLDVDGGNGSAVGIVYANDQLYVVDSVSDKVFAYSASGQREATSDFDLDDANVLPDGIAYVNERFYVVDWFRQKVYVYTASGQRDSTADFDLDDASGSADGIAFANGRFYVVDRSDNKVYAYSASGQRDAAADFDLLDDFAFAVGMDFADGRFYVVNSFRDKVYAYTETGRYDSAGDFDLHEDNDRPDGIGYGNDRFYVVDTASDRVYAYAGAPEPEDTSPGSADGPVAIPDPNLRAAIEAALGKASGEPITESEMATLTELNVPGADISDLSGLEFAVNLTVLDTQYNYGITDISPLSGLTNLETFYLGCNRFTDLAPLSGLTNLTDLDIGGNGFTDISSLSGLTKLTRLHVGNNDLTDVSALSGLTNLTELGLGGSEITDLTPLTGLTNLEHLILLTNNITDVSPLSGLTKLDYLDLRHNAITDISPLSGLPNLGVLQLRNNDISIVPPLSMEGFLELADNEIRNISGLSGVTGLRALDLGGNEIEDITPLSGLVQLYNLRLGFNNIMDLSPLASLTRVRLLDLKFNRIADISALSGLTGGTVLDLRGNPLSDTSIRDQFPVFRSGGVRVLFNSLRTGDLRKGDFDIELVFLDDVTDHQKEVIEHAARRWMSVVVGDLPDHEFAEGYSRTCGGRPYEIPAGERIDDLRIYVSSSVGSTFAIGEGAPHVLGESSRLPAVGCMSVRLDAPSYIFEIALHEVGHVLGFGTLWDDFGFIHDLSYSDPNADTHFNGPKAIAAFDEAGGLDYEGKKVPIQKRDGAHWRINGVSGDIMLPGRIGGEGALTTITVQSLADMGYVVDVTEADQHSLNDAPISVGSAVPFHPLDQQGSIIDTTD